MLLIQAEQEVFGTLEVLDIVGELEVNYFDYSLLSLYFHFWYYLLFVSHYLLLELMIPVVAEMP